MRKLTIIAVFAVFFAPVLIAVFMHSAWFDLDPDQTRNHGELVEPPRPVPPFLLQDSEGRTLAQEDLIGYWQLVHFVPDHCDGNCRESLYWMRQVRQAQNRHQPDIGLLLIATDPLDDSARATLDELDAGYRVLDGPSGQAFSAYLPDDPQEPVSYIVDPQGHIILRYSTESDFNGMRRDLRHLLTWTRSD